MKYLRLFDNESDYQSYIGVGGGNDYVTPHIALVRDTNAVKYQKFIPIPIKVGDIAYWDGSGVKTVPLSNWNTSLGTPVGVVVIGEGFTPDGKARIISLNDLGSMSWDNNGGSLTDTPVPNYNLIPITDNAGSTTTGSNSYGSLPSDYDTFTGQQSYVDPSAKYSESADLYVPSPYLGDSPNPAYYQALEGGNALSDFDGLGNTRILAGLGSNYQAATACWNYKDATNGADGLQWYLPAMGELGYLVVRSKLINQSLQAVGGTSLYDNPFYRHSSSEYNRYYAFRCFLAGKIRNADIEKNYNSIAQPYAIL